MAETLAQRITGALQTGQVRGGVAWGPLAPEYQDFTPTVRTLLSGATTSELTLHGFKCSHCGHGMNFEGMEEGRFTDNDNAAVWLCPECEAEESIVRFPPSLGAGMKLARRLALMAIMTHYGLTEPGAKKFIECCSDMAVAYDKQVQEITRLLNALTPDELAELGKEPQGEEQ